ncbi:MAG: NAD(P)-dependent oxidoreductase [Beijerinckiaceae bacterium]
MDEISADEEFSIGIVGLDLFGGALSERLEAADLGHTVSDMHPQKLQLHVAESGMAPASTPTDVAHMCDLIFIAETTDATLREVVFGTTGLIHGLSAGTILVDLSDADPSVGTEIAGKLASRGVIWIDAAILGSPEDVRSGASVWLTAGQADALQRIAPVLASVSSRTIRLGGLGSAKLAKALGAAAEAMATAVYTEIMLIARRAGLDAAGVLDAMPFLAPGAGTAPKAIASEVLTGRYDSGVPINILQRDLQTVMQAAVRASAPAQFLGLVQSACAAARFLPDANGDASDMARWLAQNAGVEFVPADSEITDS